MNVSIETMSGLERRLTIALPSEDFEQQITERLADAQGKVRLPGFRPGKVPMREVRRRFGQSMRAEVAGELMQSSFVSAVEKESLNPAGSPSLEVVKMDPGIDFEFTATFEVFPAIDLADFSKVSVIEPTAQVTDEDLQNMIDNLQKQREEFLPVERAVATGDKVKADFSATLDGEPVERTAGEDVEFTIGEGQMIADFDKGLQGAEPGATVEFDATFPDDYHAEELQGKTVQFTATVKEVSEGKMPELNDEFFETFGVEEGGEEAFRDEVRSNMVREMDRSVKNLVKQQVMQDLEKLHDFSLPAAIVHREIHALKEQMLGQFQMGGAGNKPDLPDELFQDEAQKRVKLGLVMNEIISSESLEPNETLVDERLAEIASQYGDTEQVIAWYKSNPEQMQSIHMSVLEEQAVDHILNHAQVEKKDSSYDDVLSGQAVPQPEIVEASTEQDTIDGADADDAQSPAEK